MTSARPEVKIRLVKAGIHVNDATVISPNALINDDVLYGPSHVAQRQRACLVRGDNIIGIGMLSARDEGVRWMIAGSAVLTAACCLLRMSGMLARRSQV
jgi:hypothetical protein